MFDWIHSSNSHAPCDTLRKTTPMKLGLPKTNVIFKLSIVSCELLVSREGNIHILNLNIWTSLYCRPPSQQADHIIIGISGAQLTETQCHRFRCRLGVRKPRMHCPSVTRWIGGGGFVDRYPVVVMVSLPRMMFVFDGYWPKKAGLKKDLTKHGIQLN